jgi:hypothetical protein
MASFLSKLNSAISVLRTFRRTPPTRDRQVTRPITTRSKTQIKNRRISMPRVGSEPTIPMFEWRKLFRALHRAATVISYL